jgi:hypothetical protein
MTTIGRRRWAIPGGRIPAESTGHEPEYTSRDEITVLNTSADEARVQLMVFFEHRDPVGPYVLAVPAQRLKVVRFNDLINPEAIPLGTSFAAVLESSVPVIVQFMRLDSRRAENTLLGTMAYPGDG